MSCFTKNESQRSMTQKKRKVKTELQSAKECARVRFVAWLKTFSFLANGNCFLRLRKNSLPVSVLIALVFYQHSAWFISLYIITK